jgi:peptide deformylase
MTQLKVTVYGHPTLRKVGKIVKVFDESLKELAAGMLEIMIANNGIGLAAQQVGIVLQLAVVDLRCVLERENAEKEDIAKFECIYDGKQVPPGLLFPLWLVNPRVEHLSDDLYEMEEGCLSLPEIHEVIVRPEHIRVHFQDLDGVPHTFETTGLCARCIQHEVDHLNGHLMIDHLDRKTLKLLKESLGKIKEGETEIPVK